MPKYNPNSFPGKSHRRDQNWLFIAAQMLEDEIILKRCVFCFRERYIQNFKNKLHISSNNPFKLAKDSKSVVSRKMSYEPEVQLAEIGVKRIVSAFFMSAVPVKLDKRGKIAIFDAVFCEKKLLSFSKILLKMYSKIGFKHFIKNRLSSKLDTIVKILLYFKQ